MSNGYPSDYTGVVPLGEGGAVTMAPNNGAYNGAPNNNGAYDNGAYNTGAYNNGAYNTGAYNNGAYNTGAYNNGAYNNGAPNNNGYGNGGRPPPEPVHYGAPQGAYATPAYNPPPSGAMQYPYQAPTQAQPVPQAPRPRPPQPMGPGYGSGSGNQHCHGHGCHGHCCECASHRPDRNRPARRPYGHPDRCQCDDCRYYRENAECAVM